MLRFDVLLYITTSTKVCLNYLVFHKKLTINHLFNSLTVLKIYKDLYIRIIISLNERSNLELGDGEGHL